MSDTLNNAAPGAGNPGAAPANGGSGDGAAAPATPASGKGGSAGAGAAASPDKGDSKLSRGARAAARAQTRLDAAKAGTGADKPNPSSTTDGQQAPGGGAPAAGASTEPKPGEEKQDGKPKDATADGQGAKPSDSTVKAPEDWPAERRAAFDAMHPEAKTQVLGFYKDMHSGFTHAMTKLAERETQHQDLFNLDKQFQTDPKGVLAELAKRASLEIFFERPAPANEIPANVLADPTKYAEHIANEATRRAQQIVADENAKRDKAARTKEASDQLTREFKDAAAAHKDFESHRGAVAQLLQKAPALTVEEGYRLATYDALVQRVNEGETAKRELAALQAETERQKKDAARLPAGAGNGAAESGEDRTLSAGTRAFNRAASKRAARGSRQVSA